MKNKTNTEDKSREAILSSLAIAASPKRSQIGLTPHLNSLAAKGQLSELQILLEEGANVETPSPNGATPLVLAAKHGQIEVVKLLLQFGAISRNAALLAALAANQTAVIEFLQNC